MGATKTTSGYKDETVAAAAATMDFHWLPNQERRGLGNLIKGVNHVTLIVADVGRSVAFYTDVIGLQQVERPSFDRHSAWLTAGNLELHLVKGIPLVFSGENLIVGHVALDVPNWNKAFQRLKELEVPVELNVSVPKGAGKAESEGGSNDNTLSQAFMRDPDGYYLEICNCHLLTDFCIGGNEGHGAVDHYNEGCPTAQTMATAITKLVAWSRRARHHVSDASYRSSNHTDHETPPSADVADPMILANLLKRRLVYGDICQSYDDSELETILKQANNSAPRALQILDDKIKRGEKVRVFYPPSYYVEDGTRRSGSGDNRYKPDGFIAPYPKHDHETFTTGVKSAIAKTHRATGVLHEEEKKEDPDFTPDRHNEKSTFDDDSDHPNHMHLHWTPDQDRRGLGFMVTSINHIAIIVADVGRSCAFYSDVLGLQQIKRPNFDRHGAWLTAGNVEIHLIKGEPLVHSGDNLIVGHLAIDVSDTKEAFRRLQQMGVSYESTVDDLNATSDARQAFFRDPDGYYIKIGDFRHLADIASGEILEQNQPIRASEKSSSPHLALAPIATLAVMAERVKSARLNRGGISGVEPLSEAAQPEEVDASILENLIKRRFVYGDICQSFENHELGLILKESGNNAPKAILLMQRRLHEWHRPRVFAPPAYFVKLADSWDTPEELFVPHAFEAPVPQEGLACITAGLRSLRMRESESGAVHSGI